MLVNSELLHTPAFEFESGTLESYRRGDHPFLYATLIGESSSYLFDWLKYRFSVWRRLGPWAVIVTDPAWDNAPADELERFVDSLRRPARTTTVTVTMDTAGTPESAGATPVRWSLPVLDGTHCGLVLGVSSSQLLDYNVEVAQYSTVLDPVVVPGFEGLVVDFNVSRSGTSLALATRGTGRWAPRPVSSFAYEGVFAGRVDQPASEGLRFDERMVREAATEIELGGSSAGPAGGRSLRVTFGFGD